MLVLPEYNKPYIIDNVNAPIIIKHNWMFSGPALDFMLMPISYLEETTGAAVKVRINGTEFWIPASWFILIVDPETAQVDTVTIQDCAKKRYHALSFSPDETNMRTLNVDFVDFVPEVPGMAVQHPMINKGTALVHAVGPSAPRNGKVHQLAVVIGPYDLYKFLANKIVGDILSY